MLIAKTKLNTIDVLISKALIYSYINHGEFINHNYIDNLLRECNKVKEKIKNSENAGEYTI